MSHWATSFCRKICVFLSIVAILGLSACSNMPNPNIVSESKATTEAGYGRAFGRVIYIEDGKEVEWSMFGPLVVYVRSEQTGNLETLMLTRDGRFVSSLLAGDYVLAGYAEIQGGAARTVRVWAPFSVPQAGQAVYIGDLRIENNKHSDSFRVEDNYDAALKQAQAKLDAKKLQPVKGLMQPEGKIGNFSQVTYICEASWGLTCDRTYRGLQPTRPKGSDDGFPVTESLAPTLEWKPVSRPGVTYDVVVFDSMSLNMAGNMRLRGALVAYGEGLHEPRFTLPKSLTHGTKYEWSVRLRNGDTVSSWSTTNHFAFYVVMSISSRGKFFGFSIPAK